MLRNPHLTEAVSLATLFAIRIYFSLTADGTPNNVQVMTCVPMQTQQQKSKTKGRDVFKVTTTDNDVLSRRVCAFTSF